MNSEEHPPVPRSFTLSYTAEAIPADDVVMETSSTLKYLRLRNGDYSCYKSVFLVIDGERHEITMDSLPAREASSWTRDNSTSTSTHVRQHIRSTAAVPETPA